MSQYESFNNSTSKLSKIWNKIQEIANTQFLNKNNITKLVHQRNKLKTSKVVIDTGWLASSTVDVSPNRTSTIKDELVNTLLDIDTSLDFTIEDNLLPFLDVSVLVKPPQNSSISFINTDSVHTLNGTYIKIKGDGTTLYQGLTTGITSVSTVYTQNDIDSGRIHPTFNKPVIQATLYYNDGIDDFRIIGKVSGLKVTKPLFTGCDGLDIRRYTCFDFNITGSLGEEKHQRINSLSPTEIDFVATLAETLYVGTPGSCSSGTTTTDNISDTLDWPDITENTWYFENGIKQKFISGNWVNQSFSSQTVILDGTSGKTTTSRAFTELGYWIYGGATSKFRLFVVSLNPFIIYGTNCRNTSSTFFLPGGTLGDLGYTTMTIDINPTGFPDVSDLIRTSEANEDNKQIFFKLTNSENINTYRLYLKRNCLIIAPASKIVPQTIVSYTNTYTGVTPSGVACNNKTFTTYKGLTDVEYRIIVSIKNPVYWTENKRI